MLHTVVTAPLGIALIIGTDCLSAAQSSISCGLHGCTHSMHKACACIVREINFQVHRRAVAGDITYFIKVKSHAGYTPNVIVDAMADHYAQLDSGSPVYTIQQLVEGQLYPLTSTPHILHLHSQPILTSLVSAVKHCVSAAVHASLMSTTQGAWLPRWPESEYVSTRVCDRRVFPSPTCRFIEDCRIDRVKTPAHRFTSYNMLCPHDKCRERMRGSSRPMDLVHLVFVCTHTRSCRVAFVERMRALWSEHWMPKGIRMVTDMLDRGNRGRGRSRRDRLRATL